MNKVAISGWGALWRFCLLVSLLAAVWDIVSLSMRINEAKSVARTLLGHALASNIGTNALIQAVAFWAIIVAVFYVLSRLTPARSHAVGELNHPDQLKPRR